MGAATSSAKLLCIASAPAWRRPQPRSSGQNPRQVKLDILIDQKRHPGRGHDPDDTWHQAPVEAGDPFLGPGPPHHAHKAPPECLVGLVVLQAAPEDLIRVRDGPGGELGDARDGKGSPRGHLGVSASLVVSLTGPRARLLGGVVELLGGLVHGELDSAVRDAEQGHAQPAVKPARPLALQDCPRPGRHGRIGARSGPVRGQHPCLDDPNGVRQRGRDGAGEQARDEIVAAGGLGPPAPAREGRFEARLEEEERGPAGRVAYQVRR